MLDWRVGVECEVREAVEVIALAGNQSLVHAAVTSHQHSDAAAAAIQHLD